MKKILAILGLVSLAACASNQVQETPTYTYSNGYCNTCSTSYTVSKPVEVIYKDTTYTTVYEPKTYSTTSYSRKPYQCVAGELCK